MSVDLALAKKHLKVTNLAEDTLIQVYLNASIRFVENYIEKPLSRKQFSFELSEFPESIELEAIVSPSVDSILYHYQNQDFNFTEFYQSGNSIFPTTGWPSDYEGKITVTYSDGYSETPFDLDAAVLLLVGDFYKNRETENASPATSQAIAALLRPYRVILV